MIIQGASLQFLLKRCYICRVHLVLSFFMLLLATNTILVCVLFAATISLLTVIIVNIVLRLSLILYIPLGVYSLKAVCDATSLQATASVVSLHSSQSIICRICSCLLSLNVAVTVRSSPLFGVSVLDRIVASVSSLALPTKLIHASFNLIFITKFYGL